MKEIVLFWVLYFPGDVYLYHAGEYGNRESCVQAAHALRPNEEHFECWPVRYLTLEES